MGAEASILAGLTQSRLRETVSLLNREDGIRPRGTVVKLRSDLTPDEKNGGGAPGWMEGMEALVGKKGIVIGGCKDEYLSLVQFYAPGHEQILFMLKDLWCTLLDPELLTAEEKRSLDLITTLARTIFPQQSCLPSLGQTSPALSPPW